MSRWEDASKSSLNSLNTLTDQVMGKGTDVQYFGKFRAYLFFNFLGIAFLCILMGLRGLFEGEPSVLFMMLVLAAASAFICWFLWRGVAKKVPAADQKTVFRVFLMTSVLVFGKVLLCCTVILIPLALTIGGHFDYHQYVVSDGIHRGETVYLRRNMDGKLVDAYGNVYS